MGKKISLKDVYRKNRILTLILLLIAAFFLTIMAITGFSGLADLYWRGLDRYLLFVERITGGLLKLAGTELSIRDHQVFLDGAVIYTITTILKKKWVVFLFLLFWVTPAPVRRKLAYTGLLILTNFIGSIIDISLVSCILTVSEDEFSAELMGWTPHLLLLLTLLTTWIWRERSSLLRVFSKIKIRPEFIEKKLPSIILVIFLYAFLANFVYGLFRFTPWINFLFRSSAWILNMLNIPAGTELHLLFGENGSIAMEKPCLGFRTMLLFASLVYLTGENKLEKWIYILGGILLLNISNIVRFILLFIHIQKHGGYVLVTDLHDMYDYIIYGLVFLMWILWFEKYSDIPKKEYLSNH